MSVSSRQRRQSGRSRRASQTGRSQTGHARTGCTQTGHTQTVLKWTALLSVLLLLNACGQPGGGGAIACTEIGAEDGVSVTVARERSSTVTGVELQVCLDGQCAAPELALRPGSTTVDQGCNSKDVCSATSIPNGTLVGFARVPELPAGSVEVRATVAGADGETDYVLDAPTKTVYPNGPQCPGEGQQLALTLDESGLHPR